MSKKNTENISISLPSDMIELLEEFCDRKDFSKSGFIRRAIKKYMFLQSCDDKILWDQLYHLMIDES